VSYFDQQRLVEMLKAKRCRVGSPDVHSARKFVLVNSHLQGVFREHRRYTQLPSFTQATTTTTPPLRSPAVHRHALAMTNISAASLSVVAVMAS